jgi:uncharacterized membrane protein
MSASQGDNADKKQEPFQKKVQSASWIVLFLLWAMAIGFYLVLPAAIPSHYNAEGRADAYENKSTLFLLPLVGSLLFAAANLLARNRRISIYHPTLPAHIAAFRYKRKITLLRVLTLAVLVLFCVVVLVICLGAK